MKHYKFFGESLQQGVRKVAFSDILIEVLGVLVHALALSPYAKDININDIIDGLGNQTGIPLNNLPIFPTDVNVTSHCQYKNGSSVDSGYNLCVFEVSIGSAGILLHLVELVVVYLVLKVGKEKSADRSKLWVKITAVLTALDTVIFVGSLFLKPDKKVITYMIVNILYKCYSCSLVSAYVTEEKQIRSNSLRNSKRNPNVDPNDDGSRSGLVQEDGESIAGTSTGA